MVSGTKPNYARRRRIATLRGRGLTLAEIGRRLGMSKQCVHETLRSMGAPPRYFVPCAGCGSPIYSDGATRGDAGIALCLPCLARRPAPTFAERLKAYRLAVGLTRAELARRAQLMRQQIDGYEKGLHVPRRRAAKQIAGALGLGLLGLAGP